MESMVLLQIQRQRDAVAALFEGWEETLIWSCLSGSMGKIYADDAAHPRCAAAIIGDFSFLAGDAEAEEAPALVALIKEMQTREAVISVPQNERWAERLQAQYGGRCIRTTRYATKKQADAFDRSSLLKKIEKMPKGFVLKPVGEEEFTAALKETWSRDFCSQYRDAEDYAAHGVGVVALRDGELVAGASSYTWYPGGIEIEIVTRQDVQRCGLGSACASQLILNCLDRGLYPSWDAANQTSLHLAESLGYAFSHEYAAYWLKKQA